MNFQRIVWNQFANTFGVCGGCKWQNMINQQLVLNKTELKPLTTHWKN
jgi:hypothetical protein